MARRSIIRSLPADELHDRADGLVPKPRKLCQCRQSGTVEFFHLLASIGAKIVYKTGVRGDAIAIDAELL